MKKIVLTIVMVVLCAALVLGCTATPAEQSATDPATSPAATESEAASASQESSAAPADNTDYMSWTSAEWEAASDADKTAASEAVLFEVGDAMIDGFSKLVDLAKTDEDAKAQIDAQVKSLRSSIETYLSSSPDATIQSLVDASKEVVAGSSN